MDKDTLVALVAACPYHSFLGLEVDSVDVEAGTVTMALPIRPEFSRTEAGIELHGGITAAFIDIVGDYALAVVLDRTVPTINLRVDYLRLGRSEKVWATGRVIKAGRSIGTVDVTVSEADGRQIAVGRGTYSTA